MFDVWSSQGRRARARLIFPATLKLAALTLAIQSACAHAATSEQEVADPQLLAFNTAFFQDAPSSVDLQLLLAGTNVPPGNYRVDLYSNEVLVGRREISFNRNPANGRVEPCLTLDVLTQLGIDMEKLRAQGKIDPKAEQSCMDLAGLIDMATVRFDAGRMRLLVSVPQVAMQRGIRGYVDPDLWDNGVPAAFINYQVSANRNGGVSGVRYNNNLGLRNGINLGGWRFRNESNFSHGTGRPSTFQSNRSYLQHDVTALKGQFSAGDVFSDAQLFDSVRYRGLKLESDDGMRADSERGYAPIVRGVAQTNATVEIRQNGYLLYSTNVPPGPFEISDIYPSGSNGDLEITVIESDGRRRVSQQAFSSLPIMVREGQLKYSFSVGRYRSNSAGVATPQLITGNIAYGLGSNLTGIVGLQATDGYRALAVGVGTNTPIGAMSLDWTHSTSKGHGQGQDKSGNSLRALYAKTFTGTATTFTLAAHRYSTEGYRTLANHVEDRSAGLLSRTPYSKTRTDLTINQSLGEQAQWGSLYVSGSDQRYWNRGGLQSISAGYSNNWGDVSYSLNVSRSRDIGGRSAAGDTMVSLSISFPLGGRSRAPRAFVTTSSQKSGGSVQAGINGYLTEEANTFYSIQGGARSGGDRSASATISTRTSVADISAGHSQGQGYNAQSLNVAGSVVAHSGGVNMGQTVGETFALVEVPGVQGAKISSYSGVATGYNGYAVVPSAQPYRVNWISLDTRELGADIEIDNATQQLVPRRGAITLARYTGTTGRRVQFELYDHQGGKIPFGASVENAGGKQLAISDPSGMALALVEEDQGTLRIRWGNQQCSASYALPERNKALNYERAKLHCEP
ncbi:fimbria/pilus outer membrane usher protein [Achromobacter sp. D10]|uniref:fimbria/pilus outer membrane usher protein n=1 Tax=Achromobacter sp. D10 TaxID=3110765 RepID=UPI002B4A21AC|nr:fimbria/pilus outer membrane usher protein [Achromobacter sp. D10]MEB3095772.1 fimbria/pilus outer membrane usher protein [Achromobacter sp. D10]